MRRYEYQLRVDAKEQHGKEAAWDWKLIHDTKEDGQTVTPGFLRPSYSVDLPKYACEHVFELQQLNDLITKSHLSNGVNAKNFHKLFCIANDQSQFVNSTITENKSTKYSNVYWYSASNPLYKTRGSKYRSPMDRLLQSLPRDDEFVYLDSKLNGVKGVLFGRKVPKVFTEEIETVGKLKVLLSKMTQIFLVGEYLVRPEVVKIYKLVSDRVRHEVNQIGLACQNAYSTKHKELATKVPGGWSKVYDDWEKEFLNEVEGNMNSCLSTGLEDLTEALERLKAGQPLTTSAAFKKFVELFKTKMTAYHGKYIVLDALRRISTEDQELSAGDLEKSLVIDLVDIPHDDDSYEVDGEMSFDKLAEFLEEEEGGEDWSACFKRMTLKDAEKKH